MIIIFIALFCLLMIQTFFDLFSGPIYFILFLLLIVTTIRIIKQCKKYGIKSVFRMSHRGKTIQMNDYVEMMLHKLPGYHITKKIGDYLIQIENSGIFIFCCFKEEGMITGTMHDTYITCSIGKKQKKVTNPFLAFKHYMEQLEQELNFSINSYIVVGYRCQMHLNNLSIPFVFMKDVYYEMIGKHEKCLSNEQINEFSQKIDRWMSNNVNHS